jgi:hypothetical protein
MGPRALSAHRLSGHLLLLGTSHQSDGPKSLDEVDPELLRTYERLGIPLHEQEVLAGVVTGPSGWRARDAILA